MRRILLAFDGSPAGWIALDRTAQLAPATGADVGVVCVSGAGSDIVVVDPGLDDVEATSHLIEARDALRTRGIEARLYRASGDPAERIDRIARQDDYDTIVVGTRDLSPIERGLLGSVSAGVVERAQATVIVARE